MKHLTLRGTEEITPWIRKASKVYVIVQLGEAHLGVEIPKVEARKLVRRAPVDLSADLSWYDEDTEQDHAELWFGS